MLNSVQDRGLIKAASSLWALTGPDSHYNNILTDPVIVISTACFKKVHFVMKTLSYDKMKDMMLQHERFLGNKFDM